MFSRRSDEKSKKDRPNRNLAQYGLFDVPSTLSFDESENVEDNDSDLEQELLALTLSGPSKPARKPKTPKAPPVVNLDALVLDSMRDIPSDEEISDGDDNDIHLLEELLELTQGRDVKHEEEAVEIPEQRAETSMQELLDDRLKMYIIAEGNAKIARETSRVRRFGRGIKTLHSLIKDNNAGKAINPEDIPPEVAVTITQKPAQPVPEATTEPTTEPGSEPGLKPRPKPRPEPKPQSHPVVKFKSTDDIVMIPPPSASESSIGSSGSVLEQDDMQRNELLGLLTSRRDQYKMSALDYKRAGNISSAKEHLKLVKQFEVVIKAVEQGEDVDLSAMPGPPDCLINHITVDNSKDKEESETQNNVERVAAEEEELQEELITAGSISEALEQRLAVYKSQEQAAKTEGNSSKSRRMGRIVKQFEQAIKLHKAGKPIPFDDLPTPPGYAPIIPNPAPAAASDNTPQTSGQRPPSNPEPVPQSSNVSPNVNPTRKMGNQQSNTRIEKQVALLLARQKEFKDAALAAKKKGEIAQAKELLRTAKGFDKVIDAARGGFPVDMESLPIPANSRSVLDESFEVVLAEECKEDDTGTLEILSRLEEQLTKQLKMCLSTRDHHKALGDVPGVNRFENLALAVTRDLDIVRLAHRTSDDIPKYHYENKSFSIVKCCTDLNDNDVEVVILRGINFTVPNPKEIDTYVKIEFPYPQEDPFKERTAVIKDTNNPEYNTTYTIPIQRTSRQCLRVFKRHSVKLEVYSRGGFFRSDQLLGTVQIKLQPLETQCEIHDSYDLMDGRKKNGGKLEVKIRVRHPMVANQVEHLNEKWLVLNH